MEETILLSGSGLGLLLILVLPFVWALPVGLMTAELTAAIPEEGGYYAWAKRAFGRFWGFQTGWWTWLYSMTDAAIYPVFFATYLSAFFELSLGHDPLSSEVPGGRELRLLVMFAMIAVFAWLNIRGTRLVGKASVVLGVLLIAPFLVLAVVGFARMIAQPGPIIREFAPRGESLTAVFSTGLYVVMWNYLGWDTLSTVTEEVDQPQRTFPKALLIAIPLVTLVYLLPTIVGLRFVPNYQDWGEGTWPSIASAVAGPWLGYWVNVVALLSPIALFVTAVLGASRIPFVLAEDRFFPKQLLAIHPRFGTPYASILFCSAIYLVLTAYFTFTTLVELNVTLYCASLVPELLALLYLRYREPDLPRPYKIPGGMVAVWAVVLLPIIVSLVAFGASLADAEEGWSDQIPVFFLLASGPIYYWLASALWGRKSRPSADPDATV